MLSQPTIRPLCWVAFFVACWINRPCTAQDVYHYEARLSGMTSTMQEKRMTARISELDARAEFRFERATQQLSLKTTERLDRPRFEHLLAPCELGLADFVCIVCPPNVTRSASPGDPDMPLFIDTGDPARDHARYDAFKAAWVAANPDQYEELTRPRTVPTEVTE